MVQLAFSGKIREQQEKLENMKYSYHYSNIQQDAMLHSLFYLETALHVSGGAITHYQEHKELYLQHLSHRYCYLPLSWKS
jgi:hypothetical protein